MNFGKIKINKKIGLSVLAIIGVLLMIVPSLSGKTKNKQDMKEKEISYYSDIIEEKIEKLISKASGVGDAAVVVTIDGTSEYIYAKNTTGNATGTSVDYVIISGSDGEEGVLLSEIYPSVRGVAVVCDGGQRPQIKEKVTSLISSALGIPTNRITVEG